MNAIPFDIECACCGSSRARVEVPGTPGDHYCVGLMLPGGWHALLYPKGVVEFECPACHEKICDGLAARADSSRTVARHTGGDVR